MANTHSVGASLIVWLLSGILGWTGASSFAELGSAIPLNGGAQAYLAYAYGPLVSYLFAWTAIAALKPGMSSVPTIFLFDNLFETAGAGSNAVISLIFAEYLNRLFWHATKSDVAPDAIPQWAIQMCVPLVVKLETSGVTIPSKYYRTAIVSVIVVTLVCVATRSLGTRTAVVFTSVKVRGRHSQSRGFRLLTALAVQIIALVRNSSNYIAHIV